MMQWLPWSGQRLDEFLAQVRTFRAVFPQRRSSRSARAATASTCSARMPRSSSTRRTSRRFSPGPASPRTCRRRTTRRSTTPPAGPAGSRRSSGSRATRLPGFAGDGPLITDDRPLPEYFLLRQTFGAAVAIRQPEPPPPAVRQPVDFASMDDRSRGAPPDRSLTLVLPAFNEEARLGPALDELFGYLRRRGGPPREGAPASGNLPDRIRVLVVDDGSTDGTARWSAPGPEAAPGIRDAGAAGPWRRRLARADLVSPTAGRAPRSRQGCSPPKASSWCSPMPTWRRRPTSCPGSSQRSNSADVALGSRIQPDGSDMRRTQPGLRRLLGKAFHALAAVWVDRAGPRHPVRLQGLHAATSPMTCSPSSGSRASSSTSSSSTSPAGGATGWRSCRSSGSIAAARGCRPAPGLALRVAWDLFRIPFLHRRVGRRPMTAARRRWTAGEASRPGPADRRPRRRGRGGRRRPGRRRHDGRLRQPRLPGGRAPAPRRAARSTTRRSTQAGGVRAVPTTRRRSPCSPYPSPCSRLRSTSPAGSLAILAAFAPGSRSCRSVVDVRWLVVLLAGLSWPFVYAVKLGQVGPILFLCFAIGWRWIDRPVAARGGDRASARSSSSSRRSCSSGPRSPGAGQRSGSASPSIAAAALVATGRLRPRSWAAWLTILRSISAPITTPHNFTPGAVAYQIGLVRDAAGVLQLANGAVVLALVAWSALRASPAVGYLTAATASQLLSPVLWDHYALLLLLPMAWLLDRGHGGPSRSRWPRRSL